MSPVSVVIPAIEFDQILRSCLASLILQKNVMLEVWVVFNPSKPIMNYSEWPSWVQFVESKRGVNCARNVGISKSNFDLVLFLDSDCKLNDPDHIHKLIALMALHPNAAGVGGGYKVSKEANLATQAYNYLQMDWLRQQIISDDLKAQALIGGHMLLKKSKLPGLQFDENILYGGSEKELFVRLAKSNTELYLDLELSVIHASELSQKELLRKAKAQGRGQKYINTRHKTMKRLSVIYLVKPYFEPEWAKLIEGYERVFSKYSGAGKSKKISVKKFFHSILEHLNVSQNRRE